MEEIRRFAQSTSMKGIPRIVRAHTGPLRILWVLAVLLFLAISMYQTVVLVGDFLTYATVTQVSQVAIDPLSPEHDDSLPDVNICNINVMVSNASDHQDFLTLQEYYEEVKKETECKGCEGETLEKAEKLRDTLMTLTGYYKYIGLENVAKVGHTQGSMVLECFVFVVDGLTRKKVPCGNNVKISDFHSSLHFRCMNIHIANQDEEYGIVGISVVLYLDNFPKDAGHPYNMMAEAGDSAGIALGLQQRRTMPALPLDSLTIAPGYKVNIWVSPEKHIRLPQPYGKCDPNAKDHLVGLSGEPLPFRYNFDSCVYACLESQVLENCGCVSTVDADFLQYQNISGGYCGDLSAGTKYAMHTTNCSQYTRRSNTKRCLHMCHTTCNSFYYGLSLSQALWPVASRMGAFYNHFIKGKPYAARFSIVQGVVNETEDTTNIMENPKTMQANRLIRDNFVYITISIKDYRLLTMRETVKTSLEGLISQLGGTLNLWSGISAIIVIEFLELFYRLFTDICKNKKEKEDAPVELVTASKHKPESLS